jgi:hypothetical protein
MTADATAAKVRLLQALKGSDQAEIPALVKTLEAQQTRGDLATLAGTWQLRWTSGTRQSQQWQRGLWMKGTPSSSPGAVYQRITHGTDLSRNHRRLGTAVFNRGRPFHL